MAEDETPVPKPRPIIRIGLFLISHSLLVSVLCFIAGILAVLLLPVLAKNTYISENALMPGSASPMLSRDDVTQGQRFVNEMLSLDLKSVNSGNKIPKLIAEHIAELDGEVNHHKFQRQITKFHPLHFFSGPEAEIVTENSSCLTYGVNTVGIIRAPRGDGKEAIVLVTPYNPEKITTGEALSLGIAFSVFSLLSRVTWLAKDIIWLAADSRYGEYAAVSAWLREYHTPQFGSKLNCESALPTTQFISDGFRRAGTMAAALVIKVEDRSGEYDKDSVSIYAEASNGQMPNLDLINIVNYLAVHGQGFRVKVEKIRSLLHFWFLSSLGELLEFVGEVARRLNPQWNFGIPDSDYVEGTATLASSLYNQALGVPTGPHGAFRDYQVDAITMEISPKLSSNFKGGYYEFLLRVGRLVEGVIRSVNNLLEKFHQSFFLYLLTSPSRFVSVGVYMIPFALLIAPLPLVAASLFSETGKNQPASADDPDLIFRSLKWLYAVKTVFVVHLWGVTVALLPYFLNEVSNTSTTTNFLFWIILSAVILFFFSLFSVYRPEQTEWALLKSVTIAAAFIGLCLMSVINFATAEIGALLLVPMCLTGVPLRLKVKKTRALLGGACNVVLVFIGFPPTAFFLLKGVLDSFENVRFGDFWTWTESLWAWNSATYLYLCLVHLPCWALCIHILIHS